jgi:hypothetical protein
MPPCAATVFPGRHIEAGFDRRAADRARPSRGGYRHLALPGAPRRTGIADSAHFAAVGCPDVVPGHIRHLRLVVQCRTGPNKLREAVAANHAGGNGKMLKMLKSFICEGNRNFIVAGDDVSGRQRCAV